LQNQPQITALSEITHLLKNTQSPQQQVGRISKSSGSSAT
jgi:hypothetical protein